MKNPLNKISWKALFRHTRSLDSSEVPAEVYVALGE